jgi:hypothetical protein
MFQFMILQLNSYKHCIVLYCRFLLTKHIKHNNKLKCKHIKWSLLQTTLGRTGTTEFERKLGISNFDPD